MQTIKQADTNFKFLVRNQCGLGEKPYIIKGRDEEGEFHTYQSGFNRLQTVKEFKKYRKPFDLISIQEVV